MMQTALAAQQVVMRMMMLVGGTGGLALAWPRGVVCMAVALADFFLLCFLVGESEGVCSSDSTSVTGVFFFLLVVGVTPQCFNGSTLIKSQNLALRGSWLPDMIVHSPSASGIPAALRISVISMGCANTHRMFLAVLTSDHIPHNQFTDRQWKLADDAVHDPEVSHADLCRVAGKDAEDEM